MPIYNPDGSTNIKFAQDRTGVYIIKKNGRIVYIGAGKNVYRIALRHFQKYEAQEQGHKQDYRDWRKNEYRIRVVITNTAAQAYDLERALIAKYKPTDNKMIPNFDFKEIVAEDKKAERIWQDYESTAYLSIKDEDIPF